MADEEIHEKTTKTELYKEIIEFKNDLGSRLYQEFLKLYPQDEMLILKKYNFTRESNRIQLSHWYYDLSITFYKCDETLIPTNRSLGNTMDACFPYKHFSEDSQRNIVILQKMINDLEHWIQDQSCAYNMIINKKTTLKSLVEIWPAAIKFKNEWLDKKKQVEIYKDKKCGILTEEEIKEKIKTE